MATFTMELRKIIDNGIDIGLDDYEIFEEEYRQTLNKRITDHYRYREIGFETVDMFIDRLNERMRRIMPMYNKLYESTRMEIDPLLTVRMSTTNKGTAISEGEGTSGSDSASASKSRAVSSDFPVSQLAENQDYASTASDSVGDSTSNTVGTSAEQSATETDSTSTTEGFQGLQSEMLLRYRETLINVDQAVINELETLFMGIWNTGDEYGDYPVLSHFYPWGIY